MFFKAMTTIKLLLFVFLVMPLPMLAAGSVPAVAYFSATDNKLDLEPYIEILIDPEHRLSINDLVHGNMKHEFQSVSVIGNSFGFSKAAYWVRFTVNVDKALSDSILLHVEYPQIDHITFFSPDGEGGFVKSVTGDMRPFSSREINYRSHLFKLPEHSGENRTYYLRIDTEGSVQIALSLWSTTAFIEYVDVTNFVLGGYFGIMLLLFLAALIAYIKLRDRLFLFYALYVLSFQLFLLSLYGFSYQFLWSAYPYFANKMAAVLMGVAIIFSLLFCGNFLRIWEGDYPRIKHFFNALIVAGFIGALTSLFADYAAVVQVSTFFGLLTPMLIMVAALSALNKGFKPARYFLAAFSFLLVGVFLAVLLEFGFVSRTFITAYSMQIGALFEIMLLGYALMDRIELLHDEKEQALEKASSYLYQLNTGLESRVDERTQQLAESEAQLRTLIETLPDIVWWKNPQGVYMGCNSKFERFFGASQAVIVGKTDNDFANKKQLRSFNENDKLVIRSGDPRTYEEEVVFADDAHAKLLEITKAPMFFSDGKLMGVLGVGRNITQHRRSEQAMLNNQKMEAIGHLTGGIAHDFNNILAIIIGNLSMLKSQLVDDKKAGDRISVIQKSAQRAADLVHQLLSFSRNKADQQKVTDVNQLLNEMESLVVHSVTPSIEVKLELANDIWRTRVDPGDLQDAVINLIINARDAMPAGGQLILQTMNCANLENNDILCAGTEGGDYVQLVVIDNGEGIPSAQQEHIFEPFYTTKEQGKGTGLGLAMVFGFVKRCGGCLVVESEVGNGSKFIMNLPRCNGSIENNQVEETDIMDEKHRGRETILVVDDEEALLELASEILSELDYRVLTATSGKQALQILADELEIALLLSDVLMPGGLNGYELAEQAVEKYPQLKVLLASGYTSRSEIHRSQARFSANMLTKPYNLSLLAKRVRQVLDS